MLDYLNKQNRPYSAIDICNNLHKEYGKTVSINSFLASSDFCCLLITFANSLDPDQDLQNVGQDHDPNHLTL